MLHHHPHAVQLDVLRLGFRKTDMFTALTVGDMIAITTAAPPGSAVFHAVNEGWTVTDHLLATMGEQDAGLITLQNRVARPGVTDVRPAKPAAVNDHTKPVQHIAFDVLTIDELERRRAARIKPKGD